MRAKRQPYYGIMLRQKHVVLGYIEKSFSMGWSNVSILPHTKEQALKRMKDFHAKGYQHKYPGWEMFLVRLHSAKCPVNVHFRNRHKKGNYLFTHKDNSLQPRIEKEYNF